LDYLVAVSGERGALRLLADIDEQSALLNLCGMVDLPLTLASEFGAWQ
jgi:hypothetical protein